jgi:tetratricopeptide (TPR) repeat protein
MVDYCPGCGSKVENSFKFCPTCGSELSIVSSPEHLREEATEPKGMNICKNCGEENSPESKVCVSCGAKLEGTKIVSTSRINGNKSDSRVKIEKRKLKKNNRRQQNSKTESSVIPAKRLETKKIFGLFGAVFAVVLLILIASGTIDLSGTNNIPIETAPQNQSSGIDLSSVSKINELRDLVEKNPENTSAILELANLQFDSGFFGDAAKNYEQYLNIDPENADVRIDMAVCYYNLQQFDRAEKEILTALKKSPDHQIGYLNLGIIYLAKQDISKAKEWFKKAVDLDPDSETGKKANSLLQSH